MTSEVPFKRFIIFIKLHKNIKKELLSIEFNGLKYHYEQYKELQRKIIKENIKEENKNKTLIPLLPKFELFLFNSFLDEVTCEGDSRGDYSYEIEK